MRHLHSTLAIVLLIGLIVAIVITAVNYFKSKPYNKPIALIGLICAHLQLVVGIIFYFSMGYFSMFSSAVMKNSLLRFKMVEHPIAMIIAIILITIGFSKAKRAKEDYLANRTVFIFYLLGLLFILSRIPWSTWSLFV